MTVNQRFTLLSFVDGVIQYTALVWVKEFVSLSGRDMLPFASGILTAVLPCLAYDEKHRKSILFGIWAAEKWREAWSQ